MLGKRNEEADQANLPDFKDWHKASPINDWCCSCQ